MEIKELGPWALVREASEGVGACFARRLAAQGINLVLTARRREPLESLAAELRAAGCEVRTLSMDMAQADALEKVKAVTQDLEIGILILNAGSESLFGDFVETPFERAEYMIQLNITATAAFVHHYGVEMKRRGRGAIVLMGSMAATVGCPKIAVYSAVKAFVQSFAEGLWAEMSPFNVHVLGFVIGGTRTPAAMRMLGAQHHSGLADPDDIARDGLAHIFDGPIYHAGEGATRAQHVRSLPRAEAVKLMSDGIATLMEG